MPAMSLDSESRALELDAADPLRRWRESFHIPKRGGQPVIYFCGNSLGLQPRGVQPIIEQELRDWAELAVDAHFHGARPWFNYHEQLREPLARLVGALPQEVVAMNSLTVNLHLLMASFYRPTRERYKIVVEDCAFPSDRYAAQTQLAWHGFDPQDGLLTVRPRDGEHTIDESQFESLLEAEGSSIALVLLGAVNYFTGQVFDIPRIANAAHRHGCVIGLDLAHAAGNIELDLHGWSIDFAAWCTYKYLNSGPGAVAGCFVHERHLHDPTLPRLGGWWGNDPRTRFRLHLEDRWQPVSSADGWQISNPPIFSMAPLIASLAIFDATGIRALREKSRLLTGMLRERLDALSSARYEVITPPSPGACGCQLSILAKQDPRGLHRELVEAGVVCDFREPNVVRIAPTPLYNTFHEVWRFCEILQRHR